MVLRSRGQEARPVSVTPILWSALLFLLRQSSSLIHYPHPSHTRYRTCCCFEGRYCRHWACRRPVCCLEPCSFQLFSAKQHFESIRAKLWPGARYRYFEKGCRKNVHATIPKGNMGYDQYTVSDDCTCRTYFCCFPLALANTFPRPFVPILSNFFKEQWT